jgi:hypothetical protein
MSYFWQFGEIYTSDFTFTVARGVFSPLLAGEMGPEIEPAISTMCPTWSVSCSAFPSSRYVSDFDRESLMRN